MTIQKFSHNGKDAEIHVNDDGDAWQIQVKFDGILVPLSGTVSHDVASNMEHYGWGDAKNIIANALKEHIQRK